MACEELENRKRGRLVHDSVREVLFGSVHRVARASGRAIQPRVNAGAATILATIKRGKIPRRHGTGLRTATAIAASRLLPGRTGIDS